MEINIRLTRRVARVLIAYRAFQRWKFRIIVRAFFRYVMKYNYLSQKDSVILSVRANKLVCLVMKGRAKNVKQNTNELIHIIKQAEEQYKQKKEK